MQAYLWYLIFIFFCVNCHAVKEMLCPCNMYLICKMPLGKSCVDDVNLFVLHTTIKRILCICTMWSASI